MSGPTANAPATADAALVELRAMLARLEGSAIVRDDPAARQLIDSSRLLLRDPPSAPTAKRPRRRGGMRRLGRKFGRLGLGLWPLVPWALAAWAAWMVYDGAPERGGALLAVAVLLGAAQRPSALVDAAYGLGFRAAWHAAIGRDWFAEAFSETAAARLLAKQRAAMVMAAWRRWAAAQPEVPRLEHVPRCLTARFGPAAAREFRAVLAATLGDGTGKPRAARRLARLRWSALMPLFARIAASGALDASGESRPATRTADSGLNPVPMAGSDAAPETVRDAPELLARRQSLVDAIRAKRAEIDAVHGWRMSKPAELAERDRHLGVLRQELGALEAALLAIGGVVPKAGAAGRAPRAG